MENKRGDSFASLLFFGIIFILLFFPINHVSAIEDTDKEIDSMISYTSSFKIIDNNEPGVLLDLEPLVIQRTSQKSDELVVTIRILSENMQIVGDYELFDGEKNEMYSLEQLKKGESFKIKDSLVFSPNLFFLGETTGNQEMNTQSTITYELILENHSANKDKDIIVSDDETINRLPQTNEKLENKYVYIGFFLIVFVTYCSVNIRRKVKRS